MNLKANQGYCYQARIHITRGPGKEASSLSLSYSVLEFVRDTLLLNLLISRWRLIRRLKSVFASRAREIRLRCPPLLSRDRDRGNGTRARTFICGQVLQMHVCIIQISKPARPTSTVRRIFHDLVEPFLDPFKIRVKVECAAVFEGQFQFYSDARRWDAASRDGLDLCAPYIGPEEGRGNVGVAKI